MEAILNERRKHERIRSEIPVTVLPIEKSKGAFSGVARDITVAGLCIRVGRHLRDNELYLLKFHLPIDKFEKRLEVLGKVVWGIQQPEEQFHYRVGMQFISIKDETRDAIDLFVQSRLTDSAN